jgi:hypothetical protein
VDACQVLSATGAAAKAWRGFPNGAFWKGAFRPRRLCEVQAATVKPSSGRVLFRLSTASMADPAILLWFGVSPNRERKSRLKYDR